MILRFVCVKILHCIYLHIPNTLLYTTYLFILTQYCTKSNSIQLLLSAPFTSFPQSSFCSRYPATAALLLQGSVQRTRHSKVSVSFSLSSNSLVHQGKHGYWLCATLLLPVSVSRKSSITMTYLTINWEK